MDEPRPQPRRLLGDPLSWRLADRCLAIATLMSSAIVVVLISNLAGGWPFLDPRAGARDLLVATVLGALVAWLALAAAARLGRHRPGAGPALAVVTVTLYAVTLGLFTLATGPFATPGWIAALGGAVVGYVLLPRWIALGGVVLYEILVIGGAAAVNAGWFDDTGLASVAATVRLDNATVARLAVSSVALSALTLVAVVFVVERWREREESFRRMATTDPLTGLTNRRQFYALAERDLARCRRYGSPLSLVIADLDHFKALNDAHGHLVGDRALVHAATTLAHTVRDVDVVARYGGEEFAILLPMTDSKGAAEVAERCRRVLDDTPYREPSGPAIEMTASLGVATTRDGSLEDLLRRADAALYRAKDAGRNRIEIDSVKKGPPPDAAAPDRAAPPA